MHLVSIVGARPQFVKLAPVSRAIALHNHGRSDPVRETIVHTGQHYDHGMSEIFFTELEIPRATLDLEVGSGGHGQQTGRMLEKIEAALLADRPDMVVVYGDTNSTIAGALAAAKLHIPVAHVEAGLRSFNRSMPEEINRVATDHLADLLLAPTPTAMSHLRAENLQDRAVQTGDVMHDAVLFNRELAAARSDIIERLGLQSREFGVATIHRPENTDGDRLPMLLGILGEVARRFMPLIFPVHPRTKNRLQGEFADLELDPGLRLIEPVGYLDMLQLLAHARLALTDSGGLQKEAFFLDCPCVTLRGETEWVETVEGGGNVVTGVDRERVLEAVSSWEERYHAAKPDFASAAAASFGDGHAAEAIVRALLEYR